MTHIALTDSSLNNFIGQQAERTFYYSQAWLDLISRLYGYSVIPITTTNAAGQITGYLPLCSMQSPLTGRRLVTLPFADLCPLLAVDEASGNDLIDQAVRLAQQQNVRYLELRTGVNGVLAKRSDMKEGNLYVRWLLPLSTDTDLVWSKIRKPIQRQVKKSQMLGVQVRIAQQSDDMAHYYRLHLLTRGKKYGMPAQPRRYFFELWDTFAGDGTLQLLLAEYQGTIIAGMVLFISGQTIRYAYGASDKRYLNLAPNDLLMWTAVKSGCAIGCQVLDMGRTACDNEGLMEFKRRWGAIKEPLPYYYFPHVAGLASTSESSWKYRLLTTCWKQLPLPLAGLLGGYIYKHLG